MIHIQQLAYLAMLSPPCRREQAQGVMETGDFSEVQEAESKLSSEEEDDACDGPLAA